MESIVAVEHTVNDIVKNLRIRVFCLSGDFFLPIAVFVQNFPKNLFDSRSDIVYFAGIISYVYVKLIFLDICVS